VDVFSIDARGCLKTVCDFCVVKMYKIVDFFSNQDRKKSWWSTYAERQRFG
jgi:hypothetical protein